MNNIFVLQEATILESGEISLSASPFETEDRW